MAVKGNGYNFQMGGAPQEECARKNKTAQNTASKQKGVQNYLPQTPLTKNPLTSTIAPNHRHANTALQ